MISNTLTLASNDSKAVLKVASNVNSPVMAAQSGLPTLRQLAKDNDTKFVYAIVANFLSYLRDYCGDDFKLTDAQIKMSASDIGDDFQDLNIGDIAVIVKELKTGKMKAKVKSPKDVYEIFETYFSRRCNEMAEERRASEESIAKHGYDKTKAEGLSEEEVLKFWRSHLEERAKEEQRKADIALMARDHIFELVKKFNELKNNGNNY